jgi:DNA-binding XRE family transcriptional regulator
MTKNTLIQARKAAKLSQQDMANTLNITRRQYQTLEACKDVELLITALKALQIRLIAIPENYLLTS